MKLANEGTIEKALLGLRTTRPPDGMEARIAARLLQVSPQEARPTAPRYGWVPLCGTAGAVLAITAVFALHHRQASTAANTDEPHQITRREPVAATSLLLAHPFAGKRPKDVPLQTSDDPDAIALAETLAPSQAAPPMPITAQETALAQAMRPGAPIELAELDMAREPVLRAAAEARERTNLRRYASGLLATLAAFHTPEPEAPSDETAPPPETPPLLQQPITSR